MINTALIHSQSIYRKGLALLLDQGDTGVRVVAATSSLRELIDLSLGDGIDVIVWDIYSHHALSPGAHLLKECFPLAKVLVIVNSNNPVYAGLLETLGANAVLSVNCEIAEIFETISRISTTYSPPASSNHVQEPLAESGALGKDFEKPLTDLIADNLCFGELYNNTRVDQIVMAYFKQVLVYHNESNR